jgi:hypothetical protein
VGINFTTGTFPGGSLTVLDSRFESVTTGILIDTSPKASKEQDTLELLNVQFTNVPTMVLSQNSNVRLEGGTGRIQSWFIGKTYAQGTTGRRGGPANGQSGLSLGLEVTIPEGLRASGAEDSGYFSRAKPQYQGVTNWLIPDAKGMSTALAT